MTRLLATVVLVLAAGPLYAQGASVSCPAPGHPEAWVAVATRGEGARPAGLLVGAAADLLKKFPELQELGGFPADMPCAVVNVREGRRVVPLLLGPLHWPIGRDTDVFVGSRRDVERACERVIR